MPIYILALILGGVILCAALTIWAVMALQVKVVFILPLVLCASFALRAILSRKQNR